jgi:hypothetical protein
MKYPFKYYLHGGKPYEDGDDEMFREEFGMPEEVAEAICDRRPFYEVALECEYDDETGETIILKAYST